MCFVTMATNTVGSEMRLVPEKHKMDFKLHLLHFYGRTINVHCSIDNFSFLAKWEVSGDALTRRRMQKTCDMLHFSNAVVEFLQWQVLTLFLQYSLKAHILQYNHVKKQNIQRGGKAHLYTWQ